MGADFLFFWGHRPKSENKVDRSCLSQWYVASFVVDGKEFKTCEHWMMYQKAVLFKDIKKANSILKAETPKEAKNLGRNVENFDEETWDKNKYGIVVKGNTYKFNQNEDLKDFLVSTGHKELVEASPYDTIWGIGLKQDDPRAKYKQQWKGQNLLGKALMDVRKWTLGGNHE
ncbi:MAG: NADAR family protein [Tetragenococcus koreensis]|nr:NADAR family protein [Tetragenococcus koreensis]